MQVEQVWEMQGGGEGRKDLPLDDKNKKLYFATRKINQ